MNKELAIDPVIDEEQEKSLADYIAMFRQRKGLFFWVASTILLASLVLALSLPKIYRSEATILIEQQEIPQDLVRTTVTSYADQRIQVISKRVMTSANLIKIMDKFNLYTEQRAKAPLESVIGKLRSNVKLDMVSADVIDPRSGRAQEATIAFTLSYESQSPQTAQAVANEFVSLYLNENLRSRKETAADTSRFLAEEAKKLSGRIANLEEKLAAFKERNAGSLPELNSLNLQMMRSTERDLQEVERQIQALTQRRIIYESELAMIDPHSTLFNERGQRIMSARDRLKLLQTEYLTAVSRYSSDHPDVKRLQREIGVLKRENGVANSRDDVDAQLFAKRSELNQARQRYSDDHPDVKGLERAVSALESQLKQAPAGISIQRSGTPDNPAYIQVQAQARAAGAEIGTLYGRAEQLRSKLAKYEARLTKTPQVEREYRELSRDYEASKRKYQEISSKQMEAQLAQSLETERKGERLTLIEPPILPASPVKPNRRAIAFLGLVFSIASGLGAVALAASLDSTIHGRQGVLAVLGVPALAVIPYIETAEEARQRRIWLFTKLLIGFIGLLAALALVHFYVTPLDVVWFKSLRKLGLTDLVTSIEQ